MDIDLELLRRTKSLREMRREFMRERDTAKLQELRERIRTERQELLEIVNSVQ
jgi:hypothetical protein